MPSSLFPDRNNNSVFSAISAFQGMVGGNPQAVFDQMYQTSPDFRRFADSVKNKTPEQAFSENGFDFNEVKRFMS